MLMWTPGPHGLLLLYLGGGGPSSIPASRNLSGVIWQPGVGKGQGRGRGCPAFPGSSLGGGRQGGDQGMINLFLLCWEKMTDN